MKSTPSTKRLHGKNALARLLAGCAPSGSPLLLLDLDGVLCHGNGYDSYNVDPKSPPLDLWAPASMQVLLAVMEECRPQVVISSSWQRVMEKEQFMSVFRSTGLDALADSLHPHWAAPQSTSETRHRAIERWLFAHYDGGHLVVLDDTLSGTGLRGSALDRAGRVVLCEPANGLGNEHLPAIRRALVGHYPHTTG